MRSRQQNMAVMAEVVRVLLKATQRLACACDQDDAMQLAACARRKSCHCIVADLHVCLHEAVAEVSQNARTVAAASTQCLDMIGCMVLLV